MRNTPVFADPKTDFVFHRIFGSNDHKVALLGFLNDILQLDEPHRITNVSLLPPEQRPKVIELKYSIVDVKCVDAQGTTYVVEMQIFNVGAFDKRVVYNLAKAYTNQLGASVDYPELNDVIGISICDFNLWPDNEHTPRVPMLSRWRMQEQSSGAVGLPQLQLIFLELPKYTAGHNPETLVDKWAYFFREAGKLMAIPEPLRHPPLLDALDGALTARFTRQEWDAYLAAGMAVQDELGRLNFAIKTGELRGEHKGKLEGKLEGKREGKLEGKRETLLRLCQRANVALTDDARVRIESCEDAVTLDKWIDNVFGAKTSADVFT